MKLTKLFRTATKVAVIGLTLLGKKNSLAVAKAVQNAVKKPRTGAGVIED